MTERQPFSVVESRDGYEIRDYPESRLAQVDMRASFASAGNMAFGSLIRYISGGNTRSQRIPMTAPVLQEASPQDTFLVSFVMPADMTDATMPVPDDSRVHMVTVPARRMAVLGFHGGWNERRYHEKVDSLLAALTRDNREWHGEVAYARFDPPWKPGFLKYNEVLVELAR
ncbi:MAG: heme-binding protein [Actinobacteria bacterium]|jgi:hypothetical protein|uniref:Unannotated protein n=1 Tax=freshwater metagenome TaxID=449393 RepID=A0A6J7F8P0_9ZZZZ|nr:heme-binding protein [Actinomycetota bacterium]